MRSRSAHHAAIVSAQLSSESDEYRSTDTSEVSALCVRRGGTASSQ